MFLLRWIREWKELKREYAPDTHCLACDALKVQIAQMRQDNQRLLEAALEKSEPVLPQAPDPRQFVPLKTAAARHTPWSVRRQMLEAEDREKARLMKDAPKPADANDNDVADLEREVGIAGQEREAKTS